MTTPIDAISHRPRFGLHGIARGIAGLRGWKRALFTVALGALSVLAFAPFHLWPLPFVTLSCFVWLLDGVASEGQEQNRRQLLWRAAFTGWFFGFGFFLAGLYWMGHAFLVEAEKFLWMMPFAITVLPAGLALFYALAIMAAIMLWRGGVRRIFILAACLFAAEWLRGHILTGFPWNLWGYALAGYESWAQSLSLFGIYGLTLLALLIYASPVALAGSHEKEQGRGWLLPLLCLMLLASNALWGAWRLSGAEASHYPGVQLRIVQPNIAQAEKWKPENRRWIFDRLLSLSREGPQQRSGSANGPITHYIWPESSVPFLFMMNDDYRVAEAKPMLAEVVPAGASLILGAERMEAAKLPDGNFRMERVFNSVFALDAEAEINAIYDKLHLVPFGEYVPFEPLLAALGIEQLTANNFGFASGDKHLIIKGTNGPSFLPLLCYEAVFPAMAAGENQRPGWLLNLTNDAWFGDSIGPYQHFHQARMRAIEQGLPLVRVANTGMSAVIDAHGRVISALALNEIGVIDSPLPVALAATPYSRWGGGALIMVVFLVFLLYRIIVAVE